MTRSEVQQLVAMMAATWTRPPVLAETVHAYCFALADLEHEAAKAAVLDLMRTSRFFPTIAEIRERATKTRLSLPTPEEAWGIVRRAIGRHGNYRAPVFDCEEIQQAVEAIGWRDLCVGDNPAANRARWLDAYRGFVERRVDAEKTGRYVPTSRQLPMPEFGAVCFSHGTPVLVETGYPSERRAPAAELGAVAAVLQLAERFTRKP
jgi:hypothetical protein